MTGFPSVCVWESCLFTYGQGYLAFDEGFLGFSFIKFHCFCRTNKKVPQGWLGLLLGNGRVKEWAISSSKLPPHVKHLIIAYTSQYLRLDIPFDPTLPPSSTTQINLAKGPSIYPSIYVQDSSIYWGNFSLTSSFAFWDSCWRTFSL